MALPEAKTGGFDFVNYGAIDTVLRQLEPAIAKRIERRTFNRVGASIRLQMRKDSEPRITGRLRKSIGIQRWKTRRIRAGQSIGLTTNFFYKTLDFPHVRGPAYRPWFEDTIRTIENRYPGILLDEMEKAWAYEVGRAYARTVAAGR